LLAGSEESDSQDEGTNVDEVLPDEKVYGAFHDKYALTKLQVSTRTVSQHGLVGNNRKR